MLQRSHSELQGVSTLQGALTQRTTPDRTSRSSRLSKGSMRCCRRPPRGHPLWAWLLLSALVVPGAWSHLSEEQEELLVELHNHYRGQVSPSASAMLPLKWDPTLKVVAEGYAAKCIWNHNPELEETGENLFAGTGPLDLREALEKWFLEHLDFDYQNNSCDEDKMCGHYTQMVWADTHRVGCAVHLCSSMEGLDWETVSFLVCNYYPAGNYEGMKPYVEGDWCSRCPENLQECENNLCVEEDWTSAPPLVRDEPTPVAEVEESEEDVVPLPMITDAPPATTITESIPEDYSNVWIFTDTPPPGTLPPTVGSTTLAEEEEKVGDEMKDVEEEEEEEETMDKPKGEREKVVRKPHLSTEVRISAASVSAPSLLLACLTGILTLSL